MTCSTMSTGGSSGRLGSGRSAAVTGRGAGAAAFLPAAPFLAGPLSAAAFFAAAFLAGGAGAFFAGGAAAFFAGGAGVPAGGAGASSGVSSARSAAVSTAVVTFPAGLSLPTVERTTVPATVVPAAAAPVAVSLPWPMTFSAVWTPVLTLVVARSESPPTILRTNTPAPFPSGLNVPVTPAAQTVTGRHVALARHLGRPAL